MAKQTRFMFKVEGSSYFPIDMLKYDTCWPASSQDVSNMMFFMRFPCVSQATPKGSREITMCGLKEPTAARWESFGWRVIEFRKETFT